MAAIGDSAACDRGIGLAVTQGWGVGHRGDVFSRNPGAILAGDTKGHLRNGWEGFLANDQGVGLVSSPPVSLVFMQLQPSAACCAHVMCAPSPSTPSHLIAKSACLHLRASIHGYVFLPCAYGPHQQAVIKYLYDVRRDAEALSSEYGVRLRGVIDLQLADVAMRQAEGGLRSGGWVEGLVSTLSRTLAADGRSSAPPCLAADLAAATAISRRYHKTNNTQVRHSP